MDIDIYSVMVLVATLVSMVIWGRRFRAKPQMAVVFASAMIGAAVGAKLGYVLASGWFIWGQPHFWMQMLWGKTVLGGLLGGYLAVEAGKWLIGHRQPTGDAFALAIPLGIAIGRVGCWFHGGCVGIVCQPHWWAIIGPDGLPHYPAAVVDMAFNLIAAIVLWQLWRRGRQRGQLFHIYLIAYATFRIVEGAWRTGPHIFDGVTSYQLLALGLGLFALWRYLQRRQAYKHQATGETSRSQKPPLALHAGQQMT